MMKKAIVQKRQITLLRKKVERIMAKSQICLKTCSMMMKFVQLVKEAVKLLGSNFGISIKLLKVAPQAFERFRIFSTWVQNKKRHGFSNDSLTSNVCFWELWEERLQWDVSCPKLEPGNWLSRMLKLEHMDSRLATRSTTGGRKLLFFDPSNWIWGWWPRYLRGKDFR